MIPFWNTDPFLTLRLLLWSPFTFIVCVLNSSSPVSAHRFTPVPQRCHIYTFKKKRKRNSADFIGEWIKFSGNGSCCRFDRTTMSPALQPRSVPSIHTPRLFCLHPWMGQITAPLPRTVVNGGAPPGGYCCVSANRCHGQFLQCLSLTKSSFKTICAAIMVFLLQLKTTFSLLPNLSSLFQYFLFSGYCGDKKV